MCNKKVCYSNTANWLGMSNMYEKFHRPNHYDIGGTYIDTVPDYWISCKTERINDIFLLHIFMYRKDESSFQVAMSLGNDITLDKKTNSVHLSVVLKNYIIQKNSKDIKQNPIVYITTYNFTYIDVEMLKGRNLFIPISFPKCENYEINILNEMRSNHSYGALWTDPIESDFTIESSDGEKFKVHKFILSTHSEVFKAMFKDETTESKNSFVKLIDVNSEELKYLLEFIYTGTIKDMDSVDFVKLLTLADLYNLKALWRLSQNALALQLSVSNALYILAFSHMYDAEELKIATFKFIKTNTDALDTNKFKKITDVDLMRQLCMFLAHTDNSDT